MANFTYSEIARKDDKQFVGVVKKILGQSFQEVTKEAEIAFHEAADAQPSEIKKPNAARRAANLVYLRAIERVGVTQWRQWEEDHKTKQDYVAMARPEYDRPPETKSKGKYTGGFSIVENGDRQREELHKKYHGNNG